MNPNVSLFDFDTILMAGSRGPKSVRGHKLVQIVYLASVLCHFTVILYVSVLSPIVFSLSVKEFYNAFVTDYLSQIK